MNYVKLGLLLALNTVIMFLLTYAMIAAAPHFQPNINRVYMALMMVAPMGLLMLWSMRSMYRRPVLNILLGGAFAALFVFSFWFARSQTFVDDAQFLRSMIPHHSSAILMCEEAAITDPEIIDLCSEIVAAQKEEIARMEAMLERY